jgi:hypothetical protein
MLVGVNQHFNNMGAARPPQIFSSLVIAALFALAYPMQNSRECRNRFFRLLA